MIARFLYWLAGIFGDGAAAKETVMIPGLLTMLRAFGAPGIGDLRKLGVDALTKALIGLLKTHRGKLVTTAAARLEKDGVTAKLPAPGPFADKDGGSLTGKQLFVHDALWALPRAIPIPGEAADVIRDAHFLSWGEKEADTLLAGITDGTRAAEIVLNRLIEQVT